jgi:hypothetical protein
MISLLQAEKELHQDAEVAAGVSAILQIADDIRLGRTDKDIGLEVARKLMDDVLLEPDDMGPVIRKILTYEETVEGLLSMVMAVLMQKRALKIMGVN